MKRYAEWVWAAAAVMAFAVQVMFGRWAYLAYKYAQPVGCAPGYPNCISMRLHRAQPSWVAVPVWVIIVIWFGVDLVLLVLGLWLVSRRDASRETALSRILWRGAALATGVLAFQVVIGYWFVMAYTVGPHGSCNMMERDARSNCLEMLHAQTPLQAVDPGIIFLLWLGVDLALLILAVRLYDRWRHGAGTTRAAPGPII